MPKSIYFLRPDIYFSQDLSSGPLSYTTSINQRFKLGESSIHFTVAVTETITITRDSVNGSNYDTVLKRQSLVGVQDFVFRPDGDSDFQAGDELKVECTNSNLTGIGYGVIKTSEL